MASHSDDLTQGQKAAIDALTHAQVPTPSEVEVRAELDAWGGERRRP